LYLFIIFFRTQGPPSAIAALFIASHLGILGDTDKKTNSSSTTKLDNANSNNQISWLHIDMAGLVGFVFLFKNIYGNKLRVFANV
jgi:hypothetical protein